VYRAEPAALEDLVGHEWGLSYRVRGRHAGQDPLLFLDLRNTRGWVKANSAGKSVLNLFAYTCGVGLSAAAGGAREVCNLDFAEGNLAVGRENGVLICCNNLAKVSMEDWREQVLRCAEKAGRPVRDWKIMTPGADFPSQDQQPPLKTLILQL